jgi:hypothetical protein
VVDVIRVLAYLVLIALSLWALIDVAATPERVMGLMPKPLWLVVVLVPLVGPVLWFVFGRTETEGARRPQPAARPPRGPDDDPEFLRDLDRRRPDRPDGP